MAQSFRDGTDGRPTDHGWLVSRFCLRTIGDDFFEPPVLVMSSPGGAFIPLPRLRHDPCHARPVQGGLANCYRNARICSTVCLCCGFCAWHSIAFKNQEDVSSKPNTAVGAKDGANRDSRPYPAPLLAVAIGILRAILPLGFVTMIRFSTKLNKFPGGISC